MCTSILGISVSGKFKEKSSFSLMSKVSETQSYKFANAAGKAGLGPVVLHASTSYTDASSVAVHACTCTCIHVFNER